MFNPLILQGLYYLAKSRNDNSKSNVPECCVECKHFRGMKRKCRKGWYPGDKDMFCYDEEDRWDDDFDMDDMDEDLLGDDYDDEY